MKLTRHYLPRYEGVAVKFDCQVESIPTGKGITWQGKGEERRIVSDGYRHAVRVRRGEEWLEISAADLLATAIQIGKAHRPPPPPPPPEGNEAGDEAGEDLDLPDEPRGEDDTDDDTELEDLD